MFRFALTHCLAAALATCPFACLWKSVRSISDFADNGKSVAASPACHCCDTACKPRTAEHEPGGGVPGDKNRDCPIPTCICGGAVFVHTDEARDADEVDSAVNYGLADQHGGHSARGAATILTSHSRQGETALSAIQQCALFCCFLL